MFFLITVLSVCFSVSFFCVLCRLTGCCCEFRYCTSAVDCVDVERLVSGFRNRLLFLYRLCVELAWTVSSVYSVSLHTSKPRGVAYSMISTYTIGIARGVHWVRKKLA